MNGLMNLSLLKVDEERRLVIARAAAEEPDRSGEIMDWATAKPEFQRWSNSFVEATGGLSKGNVRLQHDPKHVAGKVVDISFDDTARAVDVVVKVVDDQAWKLCKEGCITGISIGGSYGTKWTDEKTGLRKYTPKITEISLVDNPCIPSARIVELVKADGSTEMMKVSGRARSFAEVMAKAEAAPTTRDFFDVLDAMPRSFDEVMEKGFDAAVILRAPRPPHLEEGALAASRQQATDAMKRVSSMPVGGGAPKRSFINEDALEGARKRMAGRQAASAATASRWGKVKRLGAIGAGVAAVGAAGAYAANRYRQDGSGMGKSARSFDEVMQKGFLSAVTSVPGKIKGAYMGAADVAGKVGGRIAAHRISGRVSARLGPLVAADLKAGNMGAARTRGSKYASRVMKPASAAITRAEGAGRTAFHIGAGGSAAAGAGYLARGSQDTSR